MKNNPNSIAKSIIIAGIIIAGSIFLTKGEGGGIATNTDGRDDNAAASIKNFRLPGEKDHTKGNPNAKVTIVEFSDFECPFCARFHPTLSKAVEEYDIKWVYRHYPLSQIHSRALTASVASECVAKLGGNDAFWNFANGLFENQRNLGLSLYEQGVQELGIDLDKFRTCMEDDNIVQIVKDDLDEVLSIFGQKGTPFSVVITASGDFFPFEGALPYKDPSSPADVSRIIEQALEN